MYTPVYPKAPYRCMRQKFTECSKYKIRTFYEWRGGNIKNKSVPLYRKRKPLINLKFAYLRVYDFDLSVFCCSRIHQSVLGKPLWMEYRWIQLP